MLFPSFIFLFLAAFYCHALGVNIERDNLPQLQERATLSQPPSNAKRLAAGLAPAAPQALARYVRSNPGLQRVRRGGAARRAEVSPLPETVLITGADDAFVDIVLPFSVQIFDVTGSTLSVFTNGLIALPDQSGTVSGSSPFVYPFNDDLDSTVRPGVAGAETPGAWAVYSRIDSTSLTLRWKMYTFATPETGTQEFTMVYSTTQPGVWTVSYGSFTGRGDGGSARVGAAYMAKSALYSQGTAFRTINDNLVVVIDTISETATKKP